MYQRRPSRGLHVDDHRVRGGVVAMLEAVRLSRRFGDAVAVDDVSLAVAPGKLVGFVGPNGAGKTTTLRMLMGITAPDGGEIRVDGRPVTPAERAQFGYLPEQRGLYVRM